MNFSGHLFLRTQHRVCLRAVELDEGLQWLTLIPTRNRLLPSGN
jgi:hypothetical protein